MNSGKITFTLTSLENALTKSLYPLLVLTFTAVFAIILTACSASTNSPSQVIEEYIQSLNNKDSVEISNLSCSDWEANALAEVDSLTGVGSKVENLECKQTGQNNTEIYILCTGIIALDYNGEAQQIDLSTRTFITRQEDGEWRMCGYQ